MILVAGPPCGGKSTYARSLGVSPVLDFDDLLEEIAWDRYTPDQVLRDQTYRAWLARIPTAEVVVWTAPRRAQRGRFRSQHQATVIVVMASMEECLERARIGRPPSWQPVITRWFQEFEPSRSGREQIVRTDR